MARQSATDTQECRSQLERLFRCAGSLTPAATACRLLDACGSLPAVLAASSGRRRFLTGEDYVADDVLDAFASGFFHALRYQVVKGPVLANWIGLLDYLKADMAYHRHERIRVLYLNARNVLIYDEIISEGTIDSAPFDVREILRRALEVGSASIILVHNHPSGNPEPSADDIRVTRNLVAASKMLGISVHDHLVIGTDGHVSMRSHGLM